jgi:hypothetical protein
MDDKSASISTSALRERMGLFPVLDSMHLSSMSHDAQIAHYRERQRHLLWAITKMEQTLGNWEKNGFTAEEQAASARRAERDVLVALWSHNRDVTQLQKHKVVCVLRIFSDIRNVHNNMTRAIRSDLCCLVFVYTERGV